MLQREHASDFEELASLFQPGAAHRCFVNPRAPAEAFLSRGRSALATYLTLIRPFVWLMGFIAIRFRPVIAD